jgi:glutamate-ammonia-ligase adenylyltransferase
VPTAEGALYEVDTRLRPSGEQGPLAVSYDSFARYQHEQAWTWEHMALCRARPLYGSAAAQEKLCGVIADVLTGPRDAAKLRADVLQMRATMAQHKPGKGPLDVKLARGGLVDVEFLVHYLQLRDGKALRPRLGEAISGLVAAGLLPEAMIGAHDALARLLVAARLLAPDAQEPSPAAQAVLAKACRCGNWNAVPASLAQARRQVAAVWLELFGEELEIT